MTPATIRQLNELNRLFYQTTAESFSLTRQRPWDGWKIAWEEIQTQLPQDELSIWDVGCGNGRFAEFCREQIKLQNIEYYGVDSSAELLGEASKLKGKLTNTTLDLQQLDLVEEMLNGEKWSAKLPQFDLIVCFGVFHHIPSFELRSKLLSTLANHLKPDGKLIVTFWQFGQNPNLMKRAVAGQTIGLSPQELEPHDFFLTWERGEHAVRYCHWVDEVEQRKLMETTALKVEIEFEADGKSGKENQYTILKL